MRALPFFCIILSTSFFVSFLVKEVIGQPVYVFSFDFFFKHVLIFSAHKYQCQLLQNKHKNAALAEMLPFQNKHKNAALAEMLP